MEEPIRIELGNNQALEIHSYGPNKFSLSVEYEGYTDGFTEVGQIFDDTKVERDETFDMDRDQLNELADAIHTALKRAPFPKQTCECVDVSF